MATPACMVLNRMICWTKSSGCRLLLSPRLYPSLSYNGHAGPGHVITRGAKTRPKAVTEVSQKSGGDVTVGKKVVQAGKDATYTVIVIIGIAVTGGLFYIIGRELFSGQSPSGVYSNALKLCRNSTDVQDSLGEPIKGYGELTRRGRRRHTSHAEYDVDGVKHMRMKFYVEGPMQKGTVHLEVRQNDRGKYEYRYLFVELDDMLHRTIVLEDNR